MAFADIVRPKGNEKELVEMAKRLGFKALLFLYSNHSPENLKKTAEHKQEQNQNAKGIKIYSGIIARDINKARELKKRYDLVFSYPSIASFESRAINAIFDMESSGRKDFMHSRNSGINHVLARICADKGKMMAFDFSLLLSAQHEQAVIMGRIAQNLCLQKKYRFKAIIASFASDPYKMRAPAEMRTLLLAIGAGNKEASEAVKLLHSSLSAKQ